MSYSETEFLEGKFKILNSNSSQAAVHYFKRNIEQRKNFTFGDVTSVQYGRRLKFKLDPRDSVLVRFEIILSTKEATLL